MPIVNGNAVPLPAGSFPPNGGRWVQDSWQSDILCPKPGFNNYRDSIIVNKPESTSETYDIISASCHKMCGVVESGDDVNNPGHSGSWSRQVSTGWSIGGSLSGDAGITKAAKIQAGVSGSYQESTTTGVTLNYAFPHCNSPDKFRQYTQLVLKFTTTWIGKVTRYYKNARGSIMEGYGRTDGRVDYNKLVPFTNYMGNISIERVHFQLGRSNHEDYPCDQYNEPVPGSGKTKVRSPLSYNDSQPLPASIADWGMFKPKETADMFNRVASDLKISDTSKKAFRAILSNNLSQIKKFNAMIDDPKPGEIITGFDALSWIMDNQELIQALPDENKEALLLNLK